MTSTRPPRRPRRAQHAGVVRTATRAGNCPVSPGGPPSPRCPVPCRNRLGDCSPRRHLEYVKHASVRTPQARGGFPLSRFPRIALRKIARFATEFRNNRAPRDPPQGPARFPRSHFSVPVPGVRVHVAGARISVRCAAHGRVRGTCRPRTRPPFRRKDGARPIFRKGGSLMPVQGASHRPEALVFLLCSVCSGPTAKYEGVSLTD